MLMTNYNRCPVHRDASTRDAFGNNKENVPNISSAIFRNTISSKVLPEYARGACASNTPWDLAFIVTGV